MKYYSLVRDRYSDNDWWQARCHLLTYLQPDIKGLARYKNVCPECAKETLARVNAAARLGSFPREYLKFSPTQVELILETDDG